MPNNVYICIYICRKFPTSVFTNKPTREETKHQHTRLTVLLCARRWSSSFVSCSDAAALAVELYFHKDLFSMLYHMQAKMQANWRLFYVQRTERTARKFMAAWRAPSRDTNWNQAPPLRGFVTYSESGFCAQFIARRVLAMLSWMIYTR